MDKQTTILTTHKLAIGYHHRRLAQDINLRLQGGELVCLLGANGVGKSTLMRTLAGMHPPLAGEVRIEGTPLHQLKARTLAQKISVVLTDRVATGNLSAWQVVAMGRYPYTGWMGKLSVQDQKVVEWAIDITGVVPLADRHLHHLSDGERQKVMIARALAQDTPLILLDEPTVHLDLPNRMGIVRLLRRLVKETGKTVLMSTHALDLALQIADQLWLMHHRGLQAGVPEDLVLSGTIEQVFQKEGLQFDLSTGAFRLQAFGDKSIALYGLGPAFVWTQRALEREGFAINSKKPPLATVEIQDTEGTTCWLLKTGSSTKHCTSVAELLTYVNTIPLPVQPVKSL